MGLGPSINYYQAIHVAKQPTDLAPDFGNHATIPIQDAINQCTDAADGKRYAIYVHPGTYTEKIIMAAYVDLIAVGGREETVIAYTATGDNEPTVTGADSMIKGFTIQSTTDGVNTGRCVENATAGFEMEDCVLTLASADGTETTFNTSQNCDIRSSVIDSGGVSGTGLGVTGGTVNVDGSTINSATDAIGQTAGTVTLVNCTVTDLIDQDGGTLNLQRCQAEAVELGTADCTFKAELTRFTSAFSTAAAGQTHDIDLWKCNFSNNTFTNSATGTGALDMWDCDGITTLTNADAGNKNLHNCSVDTVTTSGGTVVAYGGIIRACGGSTGTSFVWWLDDDNLHVLKNMLIQDAITAASAEDTIHLDAVTYTERITLKDGVHIEGANEAATIIADDSANPVVTAGAVTCAIRRVKIFQDNAGAGAYSLSVTSTSNLNFSHCRFDCDATDAIHMVNGTIELDECVVEDGNIDLSTAACTLTLDHCTAGNIVTLAEALNHSITCLHTDFNNNSITNNATGATTLEIRFCSDINTLTDAGLGGTTNIENSMVLTATKSGTSGWMIRLATIGTLSNNNATSSILVYGGFVNACGGSTGPVVWHEPQADEFRVISGMKIQHALDVAAANNTIHISQGTFSEALVIDSTTDADQPVTLQGDGRNVTKISQTDGTPLTITNVSGVVVRDLEIETTSTAGGHEGIICHSNASGTDLILSLYNVLVDVDATGATTDYGIRTYITTSGTFSVIMTQSEVDVNSTNAGATAYAISLEGGGTASEFRESYIGCTCALGTEYGISLSAVACTLAMHNSHLRDGSIYTTAETLAHALTIVNCDLHGGGVDSDADGATTLDMRGCSNCGKLTNDGSSNWEVRDSNVQDCETTSTGFITIYGGDVGTCTAAAASGDIVWWKDTNLIYVMPNMHIEHALTDPSLAAGDTIMLGQGTWAESNLAAVDGVDIVGEDQNLSIIEATNNTQPIITVGSGVSCVLKNLKISNLGTHQTIDLTAGTDPATLVVKDCLLKSDAANSIVVATASATDAVNFHATLTTFEAAADAITVSGTTASTITARACVFDTCALAFSTTGANHDFRIDGCDFSKDDATFAGITLSANAPVVTIHDTTGIGLVTHSTASTVNLKNCRFRNTYTIAAVAGIVNAEQCEFQTFTNGGTGAIGFQECFGTDINNNSTSTMTIEGGHWDTVLQAATAGTINIYQANIATELDCSATGAINAYNCDIADIDANGGTITLYGGDLQGVSDATGAIVWWEAPHRLRVIASTADMKIMDAADAATSGDTILIGPGTFEEALDLDDATKNACTYKGFGRDKTTITQTTGNTILVNRITAVVLEDLTIALTAATDGDAALKVDAQTAVAASASVVLRNVKIDTTGTAAATVYGILAIDDGIQVATVEAHNCYIESDTGGTASYAVAANTCTTGTSTISLYDCILNGETYDVYNERITIDSHDCELNGGGWYIANNATAIGLAYNNEPHATVTPVTFAGVAGEFADLSGAELYTCVAGVTVGEAVYISAANTVAEATNAAGAPIPAEGIVVYKPSGTTCYVKKHGYFYWANPAPAWAAGTTMWLGVDGAMVNAKPADAVAQVIGIPKNTKAMLVDIVPSSAGSGVSVITTPMFLPELGLGANQGIHGTWPVIVMNAVAQTCHFTFKVPDDFLSLSKVYIVGIPTGSGNLSWTVNTSAGDCEGDESTATDSDSYGPEAVVDDRLENLDVTTAFDGLGLVQGRMVGVQLVIDALAAPPTEFNAVGIYMEYTKA